MRTDTHARNAQRRLRGQPRARRGRVRRASARTASPAARELHESGSLRVRFPSPRATTAVAAVFVNTAGGIAGGDRFDIDITAGEGARLTLTTAAAEKVYRSHGAGRRSSTSR